MASHKKTSIHLNDKENHLEIEPTKIEETVASNTLNINHTLPNLPLYNGNALETKLSKSEAEISKLISEIDLLKKKVGTFSLLYFKSFKLSKNA